MTGNDRSATNQADFRRSDRIVVETIWLVNGQRTGVDPADRGLAYGDGLFERWQHTTAKSVGSICIWSASKTAVGALRFPHRIDALFGTRLGATARDRAVPP